MSDAMERYADAAYDAALTALVWSETDEYGEPLDLRYDADDIEGETDLFREQVESFVADNWADLEGSDPRQCGHDFVLTRNRHGCGFWDGGWPDVGDRLTTSCRPYGEANLYESDDGRLILDA